MMIPPLRIVLRGLTYLTRTLTGYRGLAIAVLTQAVRDGDAAWCDKPQMLEIWSAMAGVSPDDVVRSIRRKLREVV